MAKRMTTAIRDEQTAHFTQLVAILGAFRADSVVHSDEMQRLCAVVDGGCGIAWERVASAIRHEGKKWRGFANMTAADVRQWLFTRFLKHQ